MYKSRNARKEGDRMMDRMVTYFVKLSLARQLIPMAAKSINEARRLASASMMAVERALT